MPRTATNLTSPEELARIERFIAAYNAIDNFFQRQPDAPPTFRSAVDWFGRRHPWWQDAESLRLFATIRNFLVHEKTRPFDYPCVPGEAATREIEAIRDRLTHPATLGDRFGREVVTISPHDPLEAVLKLIAKRGISRFPVYDGERFIGLLTENGIARFVAENVAKGQDFSAAVSIESVLPRETHRQNYRFASPQTPVTQAAFWFHDDTFLEAIIIAHARGAKPLGIVTRGDVAGWIE